jgi:hypothetical protein
MNVDCVVGENHPMDSAELARIAAALINAIVEAQMLADRGHFDVGLQEFLTHASEPLALRRWPLFL